MEASCHTGAGWVETSELVVLAPPAGMNMASRDHRGVPSLSYVGMGDDKTIPR